MLNVGLILVGTLLALIFLTIAKAVTIVPQGTKYVVERLGKYNCTLGPGLNFIIPYLDRVAFKVPSRDLVLDIPSQEVITKDNAVITANAIAFINVTAPEKAVYGVTDFQLAIRQLAQTSLRSIIGEMDLDETLSNRDQIKARLKAGISDDISPWGITLKSVEIQDIKPSGTMQQSMEDQAAAERDRRATVTRAEGSKRAMVLEAEGKLEAAKLEAQAKVALAQADQRSIELVTKGLGDRAELAGQFLIGTRYIQTLQGLSTSAGAKTVVLPTDLSSAIQGLLASKLK